MSEGKDERFERDTVGTIGTNKTTHAFAAGASYYMSGRQGLLCGKTATGTNTRSGGTITVTCGGCRRSMN